jgi:hypothetical protein
MQQPAFVKPYDELFIPSSVTLDGVLVGTSGRQAFLEEVRRRDIHRRSITPVTTLFSRVYVCVLGGRRADNTVVLAPAKAGDPLVTRVLPRLVGGYAPRTRLHELGEELTAIEQDYPVGTPTRTMADALYAVVKLWADCRRTHPAGVPLQLLDQVLGEALEPWHQHWDQRREDADVDRLLGYARRERVDP